MYLLFVIFQPVGMEQNLSNHLMEGPGLKQKLSDREQPLATMDYYESECDGLVILLLYPNTDRHVNVLILIAM